MQLITLKNPLNALQFDSYGAQVVSWLHNQNPIFYTGSSVRRSGMPLLFPFANPLKDGVFLPSGKPMPQHGFARDNEFTVVDQTPDSVTFELTEKDIHTQMQEVYPYDFRFQVTYTLGLQNLTCTLQCTNTGTKPMPIAPGLHPYFPLKHRDKKRLRIEGATEYSSRTIDWEEPSNGLFYDFEDDILLSFPHGLLLEIAEKPFKGAPRQFENFVVWSQPRKKPYKDSDFVCIEPFTRNTNGINTNPILIDAGETWQATIIFTVLG
jgi:galactose mutarotase-like enzyme